MSGEKEIPDEIYSICVTGNNVYLCYDITITVDNFKEKEQLDIDLSKIKHNILNYETQINNKTIDDYYNEDYEINVLLTYYIQKRIGELDAETESKIQLFTILYQFTNLDYSIVTNETIKFYKDKEETDYKLTNLTVLNVKLNYIQDNSNSSDNIESGDNRDEEKEADKTVYNIVEVEVNNPDDITAVDETNELTIVRFIEPETPLYQYKMKIMKKMIFLENLDKFLENLIIL